MQAAQGLSSSAIASFLASLQVLKNQRNDPLLVATNASNTSESPTLVLRFPPGVPSVSLRCVRALCTHVQTMVLSR